ncbi:MAG: alternative ribosome rescue aminoacyl-tRNA hydrolase ArfB [Inhella sp.]|jgi:ribosome-associated protein|uniref:alternative ribosome rescue aminoacyl-tRNA hydrolase ArfB n=1 Tax=Inhella sp. TaxID=1921806 RepID=UPI0022C7F32D|nr:alternative ribosome rescue aminoacyl-tRNA hydrolase ArfB [Inhella sp.]MCZ8236291.1 alternative ribosome rescue aminoacyl-tRNA hydrolase ArfB [Inhella sp.]
MRYALHDDELEFSAIRSQGPGGQNVNKVSTAVQLRFKVVASRLPEAVKARLLALPDSRITQDGEVVIKAQGARSQAMNKAEALGRLVALIERAEHIPRARKPTKPTWGSQQRRLQGKSQRAEVKAGRSKVSG